MSSDNQYTALGPAIVGFQTNGANIERGAEITGKSLGARVQGDRGPGVIGVSVGVINKDGTPKKGQDLVGVAGESQHGVGVRGEGHHGVSGTGVSARKGKLGIGVVGDGDYGVSGNGVSIGVQGKSESIGVQGVGRFGVRGLGLEVGVLGSSGQSHNGRAGAGVIGDALKIEVKEGTLCGVGILGRSEGNRAAVFLTGSTAEIPQFIEAVGPVVSKPVAQIHIVPAVLPPGVPNEPPMNGVAGDFFVKRIGDREDTAELWFCNGSSQNGIPARWDKISPR
jgi:hypothetical protein